MERILTGKRALRQRLKDVQKELSAVRSDIRSLEKGKPVHRAAPDPDSVKRASLSSLDYPVPGIGAPLEEPKDHVETLLAAEKNQPRPPPDEGRMAQEDRVVKERAERVRDERFSDYLASSFEADGPLRYERRVQRNKAVVLAIIVLVVLGWLISHFAR